MGQLRARAVRRIAHARLVAMAAVGGDRADAIRRENPGLVVLADGESMARESGIDGVIVTSPPVTHEPLGLACLRAGKHVIIEKPLAINVAQCQRLIDAAAAAKRCLATGFMMRHTPAARLARRLVDSGAIGRVDHVRAFHGHSGTEYFGPNWQVDADEIGGGALMGGGNHLIDQIRWFLGDATDVSGFATEGVWRQRGCEDNGFLLLRTADGRVGQLQSSWTEWRGYRYYVDVYGTDGYVRFGFSPLWLIHAQGKRGERMKVRRYFFPLYQIVERLRGWEWGVSNAQEGDLRDWISAALSGSEAPASGLDGMAAVHAALSVQRLGSTPLPT